MSAYRPREHNTLLKTRPEKWEQQTIKLGTKNLKWKIIPWYLPGIIQTTGEFQKGCQAEIIRTHKGHISAARTKQYEWEVESQLKEYSSTCSFVVVPVSSAAIPYRHLTAVPVYTVLKLPVVQATLYAKISCNVLHILKIITVSSIS